MAITKHHKTIHLIACILSGMVMPELHAFTGDLLSGGAHKEMMTSSSPTTTASHGRLVHPLVALEWMSMLVNIKGTPPKVQLFTFYPEEIPDLGKGSGSPEKNTLNNIKYLRLTLLLIQSLADQHTPLVCSALKEKQQQQQQQQQQQHQHQPSSPSSSSSSAFALWTGSSSILPYTSFQIVSSLISYWEAICERICLDRHLPPALSQMGLILCLHIAHRLVQDLYKSLTEWNHASMGDMIPSGPLRSLLRACAMLYKATISRLAAAAPLHDASSSSSSSSSSSLSTSQHAQPSVVDDVSTAHFSQKLLLLALSLSVKDPHLISPNTPLSAQLALHLSHIGGSLGLDLPPPIHQA
jgi:hypothetical protein